MTPLLGRTFERLEIGKQSKSEQGKAFDVLPLARVWMQERSSASPCRLDTACVSVREAGRGRLLTLWLGSALLGSARRASRAKRVEWGGQTVYAQQPSVARRGCDSPICTRLDNHSIQRIMLLVTSVVCDVNVCAAIVPCKSRVQW